jgi:hypothetical protein
MGSPNNLQRYALMTIAVGLVACADIPLRSTAPPVISPSVASLRTIGVPREQRLPGAAVVRSNTRWQYVGSLPEGDVYRPTNTVLTVEGSHIHEAYLVLKGKALVGYYLPVEGALSVVEPPVPIEIAPAD